MRCPQCNENLLSPNQESPGSFLCPNCQLPFRLEPDTTKRQLLIAVDVSTSVSQQLAEMQREVVHLQQQNAADVGCRMQIFTFHRELVPFPCERLCRPQVGGAITLPTLRDLRDRIAPGNAVLDSLHQLFLEPETRMGEASEFLVLTDGRDENSRRHPEEIRRQIARLPEGTKIHILGFVTATCDRDLIRLMRRLAAPRIVWSFFFNCRQDTQRDLLICPDSTRRHYAKGNAACYV